LIPLLTLDQLAELFGAVGFGEHFCAVAEYVFFVGVFFGKLLLGCSTVVLKDGGLHWRRMPNI
jgi:hypothetical protein